MLSQPDSDVAVPMTFAPFAASSAAIAAPMPRLAPVTSAVCPESTGITDYLTNRRVSRAAPLWFSPGRLRHKQRAPPGNDQFVGQGLLTLALLHTPPVCLHRRPPSFGWSWSMEPGCKHADEVPREYLQGRPAFTLTLCKIGIFGALRSRFSICSQASHQAHALRRNVPGRLREGSYISLRQLLLRWRARG